MKTENERLLSLKPRKIKTREVSSRFLSPTSSSSSINIGGIQSPSQATTPLHVKSTSSSSDSRKLKSLEDSSGLIRGLWPSSSPKNLGTLADHLGSERLNEFIERKKDDRKSSGPDRSSVFSLSRQRSHTGSARFENADSVKENHRPVIGGSMRYTGKSRFVDKSSSSSQSFNSSVILPGRLSVDESALSRKPSQQSLESDCNEVLSGADLGYSKIIASSTRKPGVEVSSKYLNDVSTKLRRRTSDSSIHHPVSADTSPRLVIKSAIKKPNSLTGYGSATSQWALSPARSSSSPARSSSSPVSVENKTRPMSFSTMKPPNSPTKTKGVEKLLSFGFDLFKSKKSSPGTVSVGDVESVHRLKLLHNRQMQWRFANARAQIVIRNVTNQAQNNLVFALDSLEKLHHSVMLKKIQLQKEKLKMKLDFLLRSQMNLLETWGDIDWSHSSAVSKITECLNFVICRVPLIEGAKADPHSTSIALRRASDFSLSIKSTLTDFSSSAEQSASLLSELAKVVAQEKLHLEEGFELFRTISTLEIQERNLKSYIIQMQQEHQFVATTTETKAK
ncbi:hypothetical protein ACFE04_018625 [Oxalis oulophora]